MPPRHRSKRCLRSLYESLELEETLTSSQLSVSASASASKGGSLQAGFFFSWTCSCLHTARISSMRQLWKVFSSSSRTPLCSFLPQGDERSLCLHMQLLQEVLSSSLLLLELPEVLELGVLRLQLSLQRPQLRLQRPLPEAQGLALRLLVEAPLLAGQPAVRLLQPQQQGGRHVQAGGRDPLPGDGEPGALQQRVQLRRLLLQAVHALPDQRQLGAAVLQHRGVAAGGALHPGDVFVHGAQRHEEAVQGAAGGLALPDLLSELIQAGSVGLHLPGQREAVSGVQIAGFGV
ncbi:hypothetical protein EYF80_030372 [Liparis tanakae]|uniref:Uncharacterized protein n=1 Tax=Liparis tanakae TaxID=230148 RepID=A0A4Z2H0H1_9TELE|nr:hypothetical protein EYF80_030372 [Liparis tanakae]